MRRRLIASARPKDHKVFVRGRMWIYGRIRTRELDDDQTFACLMKQVAKEVLRTVKYLKYGSDMH